MLSTTFLKGSQTKKQNRHCKKTNVQFVSFIRTSSELVFFSNPYTVDSEALKNALLPWCGTTQDNERHWNPSISDRNGRTTVGSGPVWTVALNAELSARSRSTTPMECTNQNGMLNLVWFGEKVWCLEWLRLSYLNTRKKHA